MKERSIFRHFETQMPVVVASGGFGRSLAQGDGRFQMVAIKKAISKIAQAAPMAHRRL